METINCQYTEEVAALTHLNLVLRENIILLLNTGNLRQAIPDGVLTVPGYTVRSLARHANVTHLGRRFPEGGGRGHQILQDTTSNSERRKATAC